jgi:hypothetical protein
MSKEKANLEANDEELLFMVMISLAMNNLNILHRLRRA